MNQPKPLTPISIEKVDFSKLESTKVYYCIYIDGTASISEGQYLSQLAIVTGITHIYLEQSEEIKCPSFLNAGVEAKLYANEMNSRGEFNGFHELDFYNGAIYVINKIKESLPSQKSEVKPLKCTFPNCNCSPDNDCETPVNIKNP